MNMKDWFVKNWWSLLIALLTLSSTYTMYGYRLDQLEKRVDKHDTQITQLQDLSNQAAVTLAKIQKDIEYIRLRVDQIVK